MKKELTFDENGYLFPYDIVAVDWDTLVETFGTNSIRQQLVEDYKLFIAALHTILPVAHKHWIDGSFVSRRELPGDIDVVVFVPHTCFSMIATDLKQVKNKWTGRIDCYFVETFPAGHLKAEIGRADALTWYHFLHTDRRNRKKGILELSIDYGNQG